MIRYVELDDFYDMPDTANNNLVSRLHFTIEAYLWLGQMRLERITILKNQ